MNERDRQIRLAAFQHCAQLMKRHSGAVPWSAIQPGFGFEGERVYLGSTPRGIHRPAQMQRGILSIKTTKPKQGRTARYDDPPGWLCQDDVRAALAQRLAAHPVLLAQLDAHGHDARDRSLAS